MAIKIISHLCVLVLAAFLTALSYQHFGFEVTALGLLFYISMEKTK